MPIEVLVLLLGFSVSLLSGLLGLGGGIVMAPALLYIPPLLGFSGFDMRQVSGLTITQGLAACLSGVVGHDRHGCVNRRLVGVMGGGIAFSASVGSVLSRWIPNEKLMIIFAALAATAAVMMCVPKKEDPMVRDASDGSFSVPLSLVIAGVIGLLCGMVGQGGSFILIPLMLHVLKLPTRVVIGSNLGLVFLSSLAGFSGKMTTGQVPLLPALAVAAGALPAAQLGARLSQRRSPRWLRIALAAVIVLAAVGIVADALGDV